MKQGACRAGGTGAGVSTAGGGMFVLVAAATGYVCSERKVHQLTRTTPTGMEHKRPQCGAESGGVGFLMGMEKGEVVLVHN